MAKRSYNSVYKAAGSNRATKTAHNLADELILHTVTEIDFVTYGVEPRSRVFKRAANFFNSETPKSTSRHREQSSLNSVFNLIKGYVRRQELLFSPTRTFSDDWGKKVSMQSLMEGSAVSGYFRDVIKIKDKLEKSANESEMYSIALEIIHECEIYWSHKAEIKKYVESHRKLFRSSLSRRFYRFVLEYRDGLFCKGCGLLTKTENLHIDHLKPLTLGGNSNLENLQLLCKSCNESKGNRPMNYLIERISERRNTSQIPSV